jgi:hypothetical protein
MEKMLKLIKRKKENVNSLAAFMDKGMLVRTLDGKTHLSYRGCAVEVKPDADLVEIAQNLLDKMGE